MRSGTAGAQAPKSSQRDSQLVCAPWPGRLPRGLLAWAAQAISASKGVPRPARSSSEPGLARLPCTARMRRRTGFRQPAGRGGLRPPAGRGLPGWQPSRGRRHEGCRGPSRQPPLPPCSAGHSARPQRAQVVSQYLLGYWQRHMLNTVPSTHPRKNELSWLLLHTTRAPNTPPRRSPARHASKRRLTWNCCASRCRFSSSALRSASALASASARFRASACSRRSRQNDSDNAIQQGDNFQAVPDPRAVQGKAKDRGRAGVHPQAVSRHDH